MSYPVGTVYKIPITVSAAKVAGALSYFPYQIDLSAKLASDAVFKSHITTNANVAVYDPVSDTTRPSLVALDLTNNKLLVAFDAPASTSADKIFYVCVGSGVSVADSANTFSNSGYTNRWGINEFSGTSCTDSVGGSTATINSPAVRAAGKLGNAVEGFGASGNLGNVSVGAPILSTGNITIELIARPDGVGQTNGRFVNNATIDMLMASANNRIAFSSNGGSANAFSANNSITFGNYHHIVITRAVTTGTCNIFINGALSGTANQGSGIPTNLGRSDMYFLNNNLMTRAFDGVVDEVGFTGDIKTPEYIATRYNQFFDAGFWSVGSGSAVGGAPAFNPRFNRFNLNFRLRR